MTDKKETNNPESCRYCGFPKIDNSDLIKQRDELLESLKELDEADTDWMSSAGNIIKIERLSHAWDKARNLINKIGEK